MKKNSTSGLNSYYASKVVRYFYFFLLLLTQHDYHNFQIHQTHTLHTYTSYTYKITSTQLRQDALSSQLRSKRENLLRLTAQRNELNSKVRALKEELQLLQESGSSIGEVIKQMGKKKVLVKVRSSFFSLSLPLFAFLRM